MTGSAQANHELMQRTLDSASAVSSRAELSALAALDDLRLAVLTWRAQTAPDGFGWGLFRGDKLATATANAFTGAVCRGVLAPAAERSAQPLRQFVARYAGGGLASGRDATSGRLRSPPRVSPPLRRPGDALASPRPVDEQQSRWRKTSWSPPGRTSTTAPRTPGARRSCRLTSSSCTPLRQRRSLATTCALARAAVVPSPATPSSSPASARSCCAPRRTGPWSTSWSPRSTAATIPCVHLQALTNAVRTPLRSRREPRAFTRAGWLAFQRALADLRQRGGGESWVLADHAAGTSYQQRCEDLRHLYAERYIHAWLAFFEGLRLDGPGNWSEAVAIISDLTDHQPLPTSSGRSTTTPRSSPRSAAAESKQKDLLHEHPRASWPSRPPRTRTTATPPRSPPASRDSPPLRPRRQPAVRPSPSTATKRCSSGSAPPSRRPSATRSTSTRSRRQGRHQRAQHPQGASAGRQPRG